MGLISMRMHRRSFSANGEDASNRSVFLSSRTHPLEVPLSMRSSNTKTEWFDEKGGLRRTCDPTAIMNRLTGSADFRFNTNRTIAHIGEKNTQTVRTEMPFFLAQFQLPIRQGIFCHNWKPALCIDISWPLFLKTSLLIMDGLISHA